MVEDQKDDSYIQTKEAKRGANWYCKSFRGKYGRLCAATSVNLLNDIEMKW